MAHELLFNGGLPLSLPKRNPAIENGVYPDIVLQRNNCASSISNNQGPALDLLTRIDVLLEYASSLFCIVDECNPRLQAEYEIVVALIDVALFDQEISLQMLQRAYDSPMADSVWSTSGGYLKKGLGLLQFVEQEFSQSFTPEANHNLFKITNNMNLEFQFLQQIGIVLLSLSKLRSKMYKDQRDAVLDFQDNDLIDLSSNSLLYAKLVIGCYDTALKCSESTIINKPLKAYLNALIFLLLSLDQYVKDQSGVAIGMIKLTIGYLAKIVPSSQLNDSILRKKTKIRIFKDIIQKKKKNSTPGKPITWIKRFKKDELLPVLEETLDDFLIPLSLLLRYRYEQTNEKMSYQKIEDDEPTLRKLIPRGKAPELRGSQWIFNRQTLTLQEINSTAPSTTSSFNSAGYY